MQNKQARIKRKIRIRKTVQGTAARPRLSVFRSDKHIYAQLINDIDRVTIAQASSLEKVLKDTPAEGRIDLAKKVGQLVAQRALEQNIQKVVFDRGGFLYHGRVKAVADAAREKGLEF